MHLPPTPTQLSELAAMAREFNANRKSASLADQKSSTVSGGRIRYRLSPEAVIQLIDRYRAGESIPALSREFGISRSSLCTLLRSEGVELRRRPIDAATKQRALDLYASGNSIRKVAENIGVSYGAVRKALLTVDTRMPSSAKAMDVAQSQKMSTSSSSISLNR